MSRQKDSTRQPPIKIPLDFDAAIGGLLAVDPTDLPKTATAARGEKKRAAKKSPKPKRRGK